MKKLIRNAFALFAVLGAVTACVSEKIDFGGSEPAVEGDTGYVAFGEGGLTVISDAEIVRAAAPDVDTFLCSILDDKSGEVVTSFTYGSRPAEPITLKTGSYRLTVESGTVPELEWESPVYAAVQPFTIEKGRTTTLTDIKCKLANIKVTVGYDADLKALLEAGSKTAVTVGANRMEFPYTEERAAYFKAAAAENAMVVDMSLTLNGKTSSMSHTIPGVKAGQWRKITVNMPHVNEGNVVFDIVIETLTLDEEIVVDVAQYRIAEETIPDEKPGDPLAPTIVWEGHNLSTTTQLVASMFNEDGDCTIPFVIDVTAQNGATIQAFEVDINSTSNAFMASLADMNIERNFDLCQVTAASNPQLNTALKMIGFPTGSGVKGKTAVPFDLQNVIGMLYGFDGTHDFKLTITDSENRTNIATLSLLVDKNNEGDPSAAPTIEWVGNDITKPQHVVDGMEVKIQVKAPAGIAEFYVDIDSDILTAQDLADVGLAQHLDLVNPDPSYEGFLGNLFPIKDRVRNQTFISGDDFDITQFMGMLAGLANGAKGYANFKLSIVDNNGQPGEETLQLLINQ